jgi:hypothetical protein
VFMGYRMGVNWHFGFVFHGRVFHRFMGQLIRFWVENIFGSQATNNYISLFYKF